MVKGEYCGDEATAAKYRCGACKQTYTGKFCSECVELCRSQTECMGSPEPEEDEDKPGKGSRTR